MAVNGPVFSDNDNRVLEVHEGRNGLWLEQHVVADKILPYDQILHNAQSAHAHCSLISRHTKMADYWIIGKQLSFTLSTQLKQLLPVKCIMFDVFKKKTPLNFALAAGSLHLIWTPLRCCWPSPRSCMFPYLHSPVSSVIKSPEFPPTGRTESKHHVLLVGECIVFQADISSYSNL